MFVLLLMVIATPLLAVRRRYPSGANVPLFKLLPLDHDADLDLPCPWCKGPTAVVDECCPCCGRRFG